MVVLVLVMVDLVILVVYTVAEGTRGNLEAERIENRENPSDVKGVSLDGYVMHGATITFWMVWRYCNSLGTRLGIHPGYHCRERSIYMTGEWSIL